MTVGAKNARYIDIREAHYRKFLGRLSEPVMHSTDDKPVHIDIYQFAPHRGRDYWTLVTGGMSDRAQYVPRHAPKYVASRVELLMYARKPQGWMYSVLKGLAEYPFLNRTYLYWYHTVSNGRPMTAKPSLLTAFLLLPPYFEKAAFDSLHLGRSRVRFLTVIPITESECDYARREGSQALEDLMVEKNLDPVVNGRRRSLI